VTFAPESDDIVIKIDVGNAANTKSTPLTTADINIYFTVLFEQLTRNLKYCIPDKNPVLYCAPQVPTRCQNNKSTVEPNKIIQTDILLYLLHHIYT